MSVQSSLIQYFLLLILLILFPSHSFAAISNSSAVHAPPTSGTYSYNTFSPGAIGFPALGGTYLDPIFGETVRRITDVGGVTNDDDIYGHHWCNADGTKCFSTKDGVLRIYSPLTGATLYNNQPRGGGVELARANLQWHPTQPDKYQRFETNTIVERTLATQTDVTIFTAPQVFDNVGGSLPWVDGSGDIYVFSWGGQARVWKRSTNTLYSGTAANFTTNGGWVSITPDGNYVVTAAGGTATPQKEHHSYAINHATATLSSSHTQFWGLCGDHGVLASSNNGKNYFISYACHNTPGLWRIDITLDQAGKSESQQLASNQILIPLAWADNDGHLSGNMRGAMTDWVFLSSENLNGDPRNGGISGWTPWKQEIIAINVATLEVRRLAHHRSRGLSSSYYAQPHVSSSWDGSTVIWASNMNSGSTDYADIYAINNPLGGSSPAPTPTPTATPIPTATPVPTSTPVPTPTPTPIPTATPTPTPTPVPSGALVGFWSFNTADMSGTTALDRSGFGNNGALLNGPLQILGKIGQALSFDGVNDYIVVPASTSLNIATDITLSAWVIRRSTGTNIDVIAKSDNSTINYNLYLTSGGRIAFYSNNGTPNNISSTGLLPIDGLWHYIVAKRSGTSVALFIDGNASGTGTMSGSFATNNSPILIATSNTGLSDVYCDCSIDDVRVYNYALPNSEIQSIYAQGSTPTATPTPTPTPTPTAVPTPTPVPTTTPIPTPIPTPTPVPTPIPTPIPSTKFSFNSRVQVTATLNVRATAATNGTLLGTQSVNALGTVTGGPVNSGGFAWWNVNYDTGVDGWSVEDFLINTAPTPTPTPTAVPTATPMPTATPAPTAVPTATPTSTPVPTTTVTPIPTQTPTPTTTPVPTTTITATPTTTPIPTGTSIPTITTTSTPTPTPIPTTTTIPISGVTSSDRDGGWVIPVQSNGDSFFGRPLSLGNRGDDVKSIQAFLIQQGTLSPTNDTSFFGPLTKEAVKKFQCEQGIVCSGTETATGYGAIGPTTLARLKALGATIAPTPALPQTSTAPSSPFARLLRYGIKGDDVATLQSFLIGRGHLAANNNTGFFGPLTREAVKKFQCEQGIVCSGNEVTTGHGSFGPKTQARLRAMQ